jgi:PAS domain S-box-containing protein
VNPAFEETFGYDPEAAIGEPIADLIFPETATGAVDGIHREVVHGEGVEAEVTREDADGGAVPCLLRTVPVDDEHISGYAIYSDISALKERERELGRQNERLQQFAGVVSHDLRSPLNVATGYLDAAIEDDSTEYVAEAQASLARMDDLIDDLLTLARQGQSIGDPEPVELETVVDAAWTTAGPGDVALERASLPTVEGDAGRLRELFENCFRNVGEHAPEATTVRVERLDDRAGFAVVDDGAGIPPERREAAFETGHTTDPDGTGFGLAIVEEIAEAHGWTVAIEERAGGGTKLAFETETTVG